MASSTTKIKTKLPAIPGTKPSVKNAQLLISTGIPFLDNIIGGGLPIGSLFIIEEDKYGFYATIMLKYFMAEGIVISQPLLVASQDVKPRQLISELPAVINDSESHSKPAHNANDQMKIAWRYQNMKLVDSSPTGSQMFGHFFDLTKSMQQDLLEQATIKQWHENNPQEQNNMFENNAYGSLLHVIQETLQDGQYLLSETVDKKKILRIAVHSLGSRLWLSNTEESSKRDLLKFLYCFRALLRNSYAVGVVTIPVDTFDNIDAVVERSEHMSDIAIRLESFAGSAKETNPLFKDYHGLLHIKKLPALNILAPHSLEFRDLAFKLRRKKFLIEVLHLPPEFEDTTQREQDEIAPAIGCMSGSHKKALDF
ncbi:elongator complex protein 4 [Pseudomyrmex gracilis]|uniref:elongator complex protein 4 n=1 Tax=Pseudomyrmex gracilis TaxID=219809 RepID=UPI00099518DB|nr:elongator complex protein 4 [Pseudomyrmex gracilis]XP_020285864.1 elongator complex protein 4 [Pseudomyrmex gracilis]XP_020285865.1 elongator complex protein 4 [Pseudomyrmex gracilis]XP_020285866.1 elongator complex protein 4 [Pseudomyrmex gracilis]